MDRLRRIDEVQNPWTILSYPITKTQDSLSHIDKKPVADLRNDMRDTGDFPQRSKVSKVKSIKYRNFSLTSQEDSSGPTKDSENNNSSLRNANDFQNQLKIN